VRVMEGGVVCCVLLRRLAQKQPCIASAAVFDATAIDGICKRAAFCSQVLPRRHQHDTSNTRCSLTTGVSLQTGHRREH
jgi:hypothetical protein